MKKLPVYLTEKEYGDLLKVTKKKRNILAFGLGYCSGLRISEILNLQQSDIDLKSHSILIRQGKGKKDRVTPLPKGFSAKSLAMLPIQCTPRALQIAFKKAVIKACIQKQGLHFHSLRHGFAVRAIEKGIPLNQVQLLLGHANVATTGIYLHANPRDALASYERLF